MLDIKKRLKNGQTVLGTWNNIPSASLMNVIGKSGLDFVVIDLEHGPGSFHQVEDLLRAAELCSMAPIVRVSSNTDHLILRTLDIGAKGVQIPHISTAEDAERAVKAAKYYPQGTRGFSPFTRAGEYGLRAKKHAQVSNEETLVVINVEGKEGIGNLRKIAQVKNIDVVFVGPYDFSQSIGKPGEVMDPAVVKMIKTSVMVIKGEGLVCGSFARDKEYMESLLEWGVQYITISVDVSVIREAYGGIVEHFRKKLKQ